MTDFIRPPYLEAGDRVALVSPAGITNIQHVEQGVATLESWGLRVELMPHVAGRYHQFSGSDAERRADMQAAIDRDDVKAIICVRGGYGCSRIVDDLDFSPLLQHPKWLVGFSDITVFHAQCQRLGIESIHGAMVKTLAHGGESLRAALFGKQQRYTLPSHPCQRNGVGAGRLVGGNLTLIVNMIGTATDIDCDGNLLFIEDLNEHLYHLDRMMVQLKRSGKLARLSGLVVGTFSDMKDNDTPFGKTAEEIVLEHVTPYDYPVLMGFPAGHTERNEAIFLGRKYRMEVFDDGGVLEVADDDAGAVC